MVLLLTLNYYHRTNDNLFLDIPSETTIINALAIPITIGTITYQVFNLTQAQVSNNFYFTVALAIAPGGVGGSLSLWLKADLGITPAANVLGEQTVTSWIDQQSINTFTITGLPKIKANSVNFNPAVTFDGASKFTGNTTINNVNSTKKKVFFKT